MTKPFADAEAGGIDNFQAWLAHRNNAGSAFRYATAMWLDLRATHVSSVHLSEEDRNLAKAAYRAHQDGKVMLVQRRDGPGEFAYLAVKLAAPLAPESAPMQRGRINSLVGR